ncbi:SPW repeat protein [Pelagibacterium sp. H642]|uniref:SPW repeat protein n=1 Tax=Pelagibacterium sp. H642 TaxID=1881069 RepID=UPI0028160EFA|nr:SPW repeat protein [Pelagibacterium sp. H642]
MDTDNTGCRHHPLQPPNRYELSVAQVIPYKVHLGIDVVSGALLLISPWLFGFSSEVFWPHVVVGIAELGVVAMSWDATSRTSTA